MTRLLYSGEQYNPVAGLQYLRARWYDAGVGRFNRLDPFVGRTGDSLSLHKYGYSHGNPVMGVDPSGLAQHSLGELVATLAILGGITGALVSGASYSATTNNWDLGEFLAAMFAGAVAGAMVGAASAVAIYAVGVPGIITTGHIHWGFSAVVNGVSNVVGYLAAKEANGEEPDGDEMLVKFFVGLFAGGVIGKVSAFVQYLPYLLEVGMNAAMTLFLDVFTETMGKLDHQRR